MGRCSMIQYSRKIPDWYVYDVKHDHFGNKKKKNILKLTPSFINNELNFFENVNEKVVLNWLIIVHYLLIRILVIVNK